jgi:hypothetical protein
MPKPLARLQPSSSVARLLEPGIAAGALASVKPNLVDQSVYDADSEFVHSGTRSATGELANITRQFILTESTDENLRQLVQLYSKAAGSQLTNSHILRAILKGISHAMPEIEREAERLGKSMSESFLREKLLRRSWLVCVQHLYLNRSIKLMKHLRFSIDT